MGIHQQFVVSRTTPLSRRESQVLFAIAQGNSNKQVAQILMISPNTVSGYVKDIYRKLGVRNRAAATMVAMSNGLLKETIELS